MKKIYDTCHELSINVIMTSDKHKTGTDRVCEVARKIPADLYINVQGDEPLIEPDTIRAAITPFIKSSEIQVTNLMTEIKNTVDLVNFTVPKVVTNIDGIGLYLSRSPIPYPKGSLDYCYYK